MSDVLDVNPAGSQIGSYQNAVATLLEPGQRSSTLGLAAIPVDHGRGKSVAHQISGDSLGSPFRACENQAEPGLPCQQALQHFLLAIGGDFESLDADIIRGLENGTEGQPHRILHVVVNQVRYRGLQRCGKTHGLAFLRQNLDNSANRREKPHVQHAVCLVKNENAQPAKCEQPAIQEVF